MIKKLADNRQKDSLAFQYRKKRFSLFLNLLKSIDEPINILDVGGTESFWSSMQTEIDQNIYVTLLNKVFQERSLPNFISIEGNGCDMSQFEDNNFDVVFSNSVIEHVASFQNQRRMAEEIKRVGKRYFLQTPNRYFPIEPHFLFPFFQFLPFSLRYWLIQHYDLGWRKKTLYFEKAKESVDEIRLLNERELIELFPDATMYKERLLGFVKSYIVYEGWDRNN